MTHETNFTQSPFQALISGSFAGAMTPVTYQGLYNIKVSKQKGQLPFEGKFMDNFVENFKKLNIGLTVNMGVQGTLFGIQSGINKSIVRKLGGDSPTDIDKVVSAAVTGVITSPVENASEAVMVKKGIMTDFAEKEKLPKPTYRQVVESMQLKDYCKGLTGMGLKGIGFVMFYSVFGSILVKKIDTKVNNMFISSLVGGALAGGAGCFVTQWADTMATMPKIGKKMEWTFKSAWKGGAMRTGYGALAVSAFTCINTAIESMQKKFK